MSVTSLEIGRYKRLAIRSAETWQGGIVRFPAWHEPVGDGPARRVRGAFWLSTRTGLVWATPEPGAGAADAGFAVQGLLAFARKQAKELMGRPARIEVTGEALADELRRLLDDRGTTIVAVEDLPEVTAALNDFDQHMGSFCPSLLKTPGVTIDRVRAFADAAALFYSANVWHKLDPEDLVRVEAPVVDSEMQHFIVAGSTRDLRGLMFMPSPEYFDRIRKRPPGPGRPKPKLWIVSFDPIDMLPFGDVDAWEDHALPVAAPDAYPRPGVTAADETLGRPDAPRLVFLEAVLRAMAASTDDDYDSGRWTRSVETMDGVVDVRLSLPHLLDQMAGRGDVVRGVPGGQLPFEDMRIDMERAMRAAARKLQEAPLASMEDAQRAIETVMAQPDAGTALPANATPLERAQDLADQAGRAAGRRRIQLARQALALSPDCADARLVLAEQEPDLHAAIPLYREAVAAGERALGPDIFAREAGHFWGLVETRPYMRARAELARALDEAGEFDEAAGHYRELLRLNPGDNQGVREQLLACLLDMGRDTEAEALVVQMKDDESASWLYAAALVAFKSGGDSPFARERLARAMAANVLVVPFLTGERRIPALPATYRLGSLDEAAIAANWQLPYWTETPAALYWLNTLRRESKKTAKPTRAPRRAPRRR